MNASSEAVTGDGDAPISVFLLDDHEVVRRGLRNLLTAEPGIDVIGEAGTVASALARVTGAAARRRRARRAAAGR